MSLKNLNSIDSTKITDTAKKCVAVGGVYSAAKVNGRIVYESCNMSEFIKSFGDGIKFIPDTGNSKETLKSMFNIDLTKGSQAI